MKGSSANRTGGISPGEVVYTLPTDKGFVRPDTFTHHRSLRQAIEDKNVDTDFPSFISNPDKGTIFKPKRVQVIRPDHQSGSIFSLGRSRCFRERGVKKVPGRRGDQTIWFFF